MLSDSDEDLSGTDYGSDEIVEEITSPKKRKLCTSSKVTKLKTKKMETTNETEVTEPREEKPSLPKPGFFITFIVDKEPITQIFVVHRSVATDMSPFFEAEFKSEFPVGRAQSMRLEDVETETFGLLVFWMYLEDINIKETRDPLSYEKMLLPLSKFWVLAKQCQMPGLQDQIMERLVVAINEAKWEDLTWDLLQNFLQYAYDSGSPQLKRIALDTVALTVKTADFRRSCSRFSLEVLLEIMMVLKPRHPEGGMDGFFVDTSPYMVH